jgi:hypothetical protein
MLCSNFEQREAMMDLSNLDKNDLVTILKMIETGANYEEALKEYVPSDVAGIIRSLHNIYCKESHQGEGVEGENYCGFYDEELWTDPAHSKWLALLNQVFKKCECDIYEINSVFHYLVKFETIKEEVTKKEGEKGLLILNTLLKLPNI